MEVLATLTKTIDGRVSTWRFCKMAEGLCAIGGNYKLVQYRNEWSMNKSKQWFLDKGYAEVVAA